MALARALGLSRRMVRRWQGEAWAAMQDENGHQKGATGGAYLSEALAAGTALVGALGDQGRIRVLDAREAALLHGGLADRTFRLLAGLARDARL